MLSQKIYKNNESTAKVSGKFFPFERGVKKGIRRKKKTFSEKLFANILEEVFKSLTNLWESMRIIIDPRKLAHYPFAHD